MRPLFVALALCLLSIGVPAQVLAQAVYWEGDYGGKHYAGWYSSDKLCCNDPRCGMRQDILRMIAASQAPIPSAAYVSAPIAPDYSITYETVQVPYQVKMCDGKRCWYETQYRTERRPVRSAIKAVRNIIDAATPRINMLRVTDLAPTPIDAVVAMLEIARPKPTEVLYDLGCGDGRVLVNASATYGCRSVRIELNPTSFKAAADLVDVFGLAKVVRLYQGDVLSYSYPEADIVTMYLYPELIAQVVPRLRKGTRVVSYLHPLPGGTVVTSGGFTFHTLTIE